MIEFVVSKFQTRILIQVSLSIATTTGLWLILALQPMLWFGLFSLIFLRRSYLALQLVRVAGLGALLYGGATASTDSRAFKIITI